MMEVFPLFSHVLGVLVKMHITFDKRSLSSKLLPWANLCSSRLLIKTVTMYIDSIPTHY
jgi:hypothetical protein